MAVLLKEGVWMANIIYIRVSTEEQNTGRQYVLLNEKGIMIDKVFEEKVSGKNSKERPQLKALIEYVRSGDVVIVESISRLARSTKDFITILDTLQEKEVAFVSLKESVDTTTPQGKFMLTVFGALAELERETIRQRQQEGIALALAEGRPYGRPRAKFSSTFNQNYDKWKRGEFTAVEFMRKEQLTKSTFYKLVKRYENKSIN